MRLLASALCDHAAATPQGKLDVHGVFHDLYAGGFPARQDRMFLVLVLEWDSADSGRYAFRVDVAGPDGKPALTVEGQSEVTPRPASLTFTMADWNAVQTVTVTAHDDASA